jgi:hypothetical protein
MSTQTNLRPRPAGEAAEVVVAADAVRRARTARLLAA